MTEAEGNRYWKPARCRVASILPDEDLDPAYGGAKTLGGLLGLNYSYPGKWRDTELTDELKNTLELINGPNGHAIIKILQLRQQGETLEEKHLQDIGGASS